MMIPPGLSSPVQDLAHMLDLRGRETPAAEAVHFGGESLTFGELHNRTLAFAAKLSALGVTRGDRVVLVLPNSHDFFHVFYGILWLGATAAPLYPGDSPERTLKIARLCGARLVVIPREGDPSKREAFEAAAEGFCKVIDAAPEHPKKTPARSARPTDIAFLQYTSGSTGDPKGVMLTHERLLINVQQMIDGMEITPADVFISWLPVYHDMGLILKTMTPFYLNARLILLPTSLANVTAWLRAIRDFGGTFSAAPDFAWRLATRFVKRPEEYPLHTLRVALNAAEPVRAATAAGFEKKFGLHGVMTAGYGLAEATVGVSMSRPGRPLTVDEKGLVSVGEPFADVEIRIETEDDHPADLHHYGEILVRSKANCIGYYNNKLATERLFQPGDGWFRSGDMGYTDTSGRLFIAGRKKSIIITAGRTFANQEVEEILDMHPLVRAAAAIGFGGGSDRGEQIFAFVETKGAMGLTESQKEDLVVDLVTRVHQSLGVRPGRVYLVKNHTIPKTYNGKVRHLALLTDYQSGHLRESGRILFPEY